MSTKSATRSPAKKAEPAITPDAWYALDILHVAADFFAEHMEGNNTLAGLIVSDLGSAADALEAGEPLPVDELRADIDRLEVDKAFGAGHGFAVLLGYVLDKYEEERA